MRCITLPSEYVLKALAAGGFTAKSNFQVYIFTHQNRLYKRDTQLLPAPRRMTHRQQDHLRQPTAVVREELARRGRCGQLRWRADESLASARQPVRLYGWMEALHPPGTAKSVRESVSLKSARVDPALPPPLPLHPPVFLTPMHALLSLEENKRFLRENKKAKIASLVHKQCVNAVQTKDRMSSTVKQKYDRDASLCQANEQRSDIIRTVYICPNKIYHCHDCEEMGSVVPHIPLWHPSALWPAITLLDETCL
jgi:hypothetical protein